MGEDKLRPYSGSTTAKIPYAVERNGTGVLEGLGDRVRYDITAKYEQDVPC